jgi:glycerol-3-phosphate dehydrogenase (NAD(P)+)
MSESPLSRIAVLGAGSWGTSLAILVGHRGIPVTLWGHDAGHILEVANTRENSTYLPGVKLADAIQPTADLAAAAQSDAVLVVVPSKALREVAARFSKAGVPKTTILVTCTKGIERGSGRRMSEILWEFFPDNPIAALSGPSHAEEVARNMPTALVIGSQDTAIARSLQHTITGPFFRPYTSPDIAGIELGGALKNIFAIAAGCGDGLGLGDNSKAALVTRSLAELIRVGVALGGKRETFQGLSGIGDLIVTCFSKHSRNRGVGERLGRGETIESISNSMKMVAEGVPTTLSVFEWARQHDIRTPIIDAVHSVLYENREPCDVMTELLNRDPRPEEDADDSGA